ncbi:MAG: Tol-Pal system beta propeller repeat protein TolB [Acetobacterales bacterium]
MTFQQTPRRLAQAAAAALAVLAVVAPARAELQIDITRGQVEPLPIAIVDFTGDAPSGGELGRNVAEVITSDLRNSGLFKPVDPEAFIQSTDAFNVQPRFADWRVIGAQALVHGRMQNTQDGRVRVEFRLWDVVAEQQMKGLAYSTVERNWRRIAHIIADDIYERLTGERGYFDTRIVYVAESGARNRRVKRLAIMDQDGANHRFLTDGRNLVLTPRFSPAADMITFLSYQDDRPRVYLFNIDTGRQELVGDFPSMTFAPRFSPDGNKVLMSLADKGNSDVHVMDLRTRQSRRLTNSPAIDVSPSFAPDEEAIVFNSDRSGRQQLYVMKPDGSDQRRISFGNGSYATPVWSPRGDYIAFTKIEGGQFFIGIMRPDGSGERLLADGYRVEGPTWAPNGRVLMFFRQSRFDAQGGSGSVRLYSVDITGYNERQIDTPMDASDPAWSPLLR